MLNNPLPELSPPDRALERAIYFMDLTKWDRALPELQQALAHDPASPHLHYLIGLCHYHLDAYAKARKSAQEAIALYPAYDEAYWLLASVALQQNRHQDGMRAIKQALELDSENALYLGTLAALHLSQRHFREALQAAEAALAIDPEEALARHIRTLALTELGRHDEASLQAEDSLAREPDDATTWYLRGVQLLSQGKVADAKAALLESLRLNPENQEAQDALLRAVSVNHPFFGLFWRWTIFLYRFPPAARWGVILGLWALMRVLRGMSASLPALKPVIAVVGICYVLFCLYTWLAQPLFNFSIKRGWIR